MLWHYQNQSCPELAELMRKEDITYSVLINILNSSSADLFTDHETVVICHSAHPWPVWIWCRDPEDPTAVMAIAGVLKEQLPLHTVRYCIMPEALAGSLKKADMYFSDARPGMGLLSYRLDHIEEIGHPCEGAMSLVRAEEIDGLVDVWHAMHLEMEGMDRTREHCLETMRRMVEEGSLFTWRVNGQIAALTARGDRPPYSKITSVYTLPGHRRKGYAINLVSGVTKTILAEGLIPILYTDAAYGASNDCYRKIGYRQVGSLVSLCK